MWAINATLIRKAALAALMVTALAVLGPAPAGAAIFGDFSASLPADEAVTMGDSTDVLSFTITNDPGSRKPIKTVFFNIDTSLYTLSSAWLAPTSCTNNWTVRGDLPACVLPGCTSVSSGGGIPPGDSCTFDVIVNGSADNLFTADTQDQTDTLINIVASSNAGASLQKGEFNLTGSLPTWQRKSLDISMSATPASVSTAEQIVLTMTVVNRSSASQSLLGGNPDPPTPTYTGGASVSAIGLPIYSSTAATANPSAATLKNNMDASQITVSLFSSSGLPASGRVLIGTELIDYTGISGNSLTGATRGVGGTTAASHDKWNIVYSQNTSAFTIASEETATITWIFKAVATGTVYFTSRGQNAAVTATSKIGDSNVVVIGNFTAQVSVTPLLVISGQQVTVTMEVSNNSGSALTNVTPTLTPGGTATATLVSGPSPASISTLGVGESGQFQWTYTITGTVGQTFNFDGFAASGVQTTNTDTSDTGDITVYSVTLSPDIVNSGATNVTFTWTVYNSGIDPIQQIDIPLPVPLTADCGATPGWGYQSDTPPSGWSSSTTGAPVSLVTFNANNPVGTNGILFGQSKDFSITFSCVPTVVFDTTFNFAIDITDQANNTATVDTDVVVTAFILDLEAFDDDCTSPPPASKDADGISQYCFVATLSTSGVPEVGKTIQFSITSGLGALSAASGVTDGSGQATVLLTAPCSTTDVDTTVKAEYTADSTDSETVSFVAIISGTLNYIPGSLTFNRTAPAPIGDINPVSIDTGDTGTFRLDLMNCGPATLTLQTANSSLAVTTDAPDTFALSGVVLINPGATATLEFVSGTISSPVLQCSPLLTVDAGAGYFGPFSFNNVPPGDLLDDTITVSGGTECLLDIIILDWREVF